MSKDKLAFLGAIPFINFFIIVSYCHLILRKKDILKKQKKQFKLKIPSIVLNINFSLIIIYIVLDELNDWTEVNSSGRIIYGVAVLSLVLFPFCSLLNQTTKVLIRLDNKRLNIENRALYFFYIMVFPLCIYKFHDRINN